MDQFIFWKVTIGDLIQVLSLLVTIWIAIVVQKNLSRKQYLKKFFIDEISNIREEYKAFILALLENSVSSKQIINKFKILSCRIRVLGKNLSRCYDYRLSDLKEAHFQFQQNITGLDDVNQQYEDEVVSFSESSKREIYRLHEKLIEEIENLVIDVSNLN